jgi:hypothetical protein
MFFVLVPPLSLELIGDVSNSRSERGIVMSKVLFALPLLFAFFSVFHVDAEEVTLKGKVTCAKCDLKVTDECATVVVVKENDKDVVYYFDAAADKKDHKAICKASKDGSVTGEVSKAGDKHMIKVSKVEYNP